MSMEEMMKAVKELELQTTEIKEAKEKLANLEEKYDKSKMAVAEKTRETKALNDKIKALEQELALDNTLMEIKKILWAKINQSIIGQWRSIQAMINNYFTGLVFTKSEASANLYHIMVEGSQLIIVLYVDDLMLTGDDQWIMSFKEEFAREFEMKDMSLMHYFLGMEVWQKDGDFFVSQGEYANEILRRFHMEKCKPMQTPLANLCYAVNQLSQSMVQPTKLFWKDAKHVLRYLRGTSQYGLWYKWTEGVKL
eukprot:PITA_33913